MKLWVIAKPGPYIRAEWNFGGFPAWLHAKGVRHFRTSDFTYMNAVDRYLDKVLPILARPAQRGRLGLLGPDRRYL